MSSGFLPSSPARHHFHPNSPREVENNLLDLGLLGTNKSRSKHGSKKPPKTKKPKTVEFGSTVAHHSTAPFPPLRLVSARRHS
jgi:hypothetical protein